MVIVLTFSPSIKKAAQLNAIARAAMYAIRAQWRAVAV